MMVAITHGPMVARQRAAIRLDRLIMPPAPEFGLTKPRRRPTGLNWVCISADVKQQCAIALDRRLTSAYRLVVSIAKECHMRWFTTILCVGLLGCASSGASTGASTPQETVRISGGVGLPTTTVDIHPTTANAVTTVGFTVDRAWGVLRAVYDSLGIAVSTTDAASHTLGATAMKVRPRLGRVP